ncbi:MULTISPECIES: ABC transporter permease [Mesorhizobium]|uniref:Putative spermidine/putrescine transport system permease protein n=1 Tax=Mesorhizobium qingshengii TaxID=1165689 RepID=A0A1G5ZY08_9HYPH|nr:MULTISPECIES: ABC transporter permease subunit [Mesorhizobium]MCH4561243.1 ABC transporter permease subunit [Mesorhizobium jarvisii]QGU21174.1 ABC transporter permease subunit [Mesorhizobium huakuii 7653R]SDA99674.1 putative spermidine/putrescine transport system permease protein [Mesorhizobium qingshengii]
MKTVLRLLPWAAIVVAGIYFLLPLISTAEFSLSIRRDGYSLDAYRSVFSDPEFFATFGYSAVIAVCTIVFGVVLVVPMTYFVRLRFPWLRPIVEFIVMLPLVVPPIVLVFGYLKLFSSSSVLPLTSTEMGSNALLVCGYMTLSLPYFYRAVDSGLQAIDARTLTDAATILGASPITVIRLVILPNILFSVLSGAFLTFAVVISEFVMASLLTRPAFGTYIQKVGVAQAYEPAALAILSFAITWGAMGMIQLLARFAPQKHER